MSVKKSLVLFLSMVLAFSASLRVYLLNSDAAAASYMDVPALQQLDPAWGTRYFGKWTFAASGCGIMSTLNTVRFLTGNMFDPWELAEFAHGDGSYNPDGGMGVWRWLFFVENGTLEKSGILEKSNVKFTKYWGGAAYTPSAMIPYLEAGNVCIIHIPGHFMAIAGYDAASDKYFVLDSAINPQRGTFIDGSWLPASAFKEGGSSQMDAFAAFAAVGAPAEQSRPPVNSSATRYPVYLNIISGNGSSYFVDSTEISRAVKIGQMVKFEVMPEEGYVISSVVIGGTPQTIQNGGGKAVYSFGMPNGSIGVDIKFVKGNPVTPTPTPTSAPTSAPTPTPKITLSPKPAATPTPKITSSPKPAATSTPAQKTAAAQTQSAAPTAARAESLKPDKTEGEALLSTGIAETPAEVSDKTTPDAIMPGTSNETEENTSATAAAETGGYTDSRPSDTEAAEKNDNGSPEKGCGGIISGAASLLAMMCAAAVLLGKKAD